jgi:hypothetical protein
MYRTMGLKDAVHTVMAVAGSYVLIRVAMLLTSSRVAIGLIEQHLTFQAQEPPKPVKIDHPTNIVQTEKDIFAQPTFLGKPI